MAGLKNLYKNININYKFNILGKSKAKINLWSYKMFFYTKKVIWELSFKITYLSSINKTKLILMFMNIIIFWNIILSKYIKT